MNILQAAILGLVQGLGEFLPISSSGHLLLSRILMGFTIDETGAYHMLDILLHVGTLIPVLIVFWKDWWAILKNPFKSKTLLLLFIASLPTLLFKVVFDDFITSCETGWFLGASFLLTGFFLPHDQRYWGYLIGIGIMGLLAYMQHARTTQTTEAAA